MRDREWRSIAHRLADQLETVTALVSGGKRQLVAMLDKPPRTRTDEQIRALQSDLEEAERLLAVTAQDVADLGSQ